MKEMKNRIFTLFIVLLSASMASAQLHFSGNNNIYYGTASITAEEIDADWDVVNSTQSDLELSARRYAIQEVEGADGNFCWGFLCIAWGNGDYNASSEVVYLPAGETDNTFKAKYRHHGNEGHAIYRYCIYDVNRIIEDVCQEVNFCVNVECLVSTNDMADFHGEIVVSPNPIEKIGNVEYRFKNRPSNGKLVVYNTVGVKVKEVPLKSREGVVFLGASDFSSGLYFCSIEDNGVTYETVRIMFQ